jgi:hypothetical protein
MNQRCREVDIDDALPGMVLANAIMDGHGGVLLPPGAELTESVLRGLRRRGVEQFQVLNSDVSEAELAVEREQVQQRLDRLFRLSAGEETNRQLMQYLSAYRLGEAS